MTEIDSIKIEDKNDEAKMLAYYKLTKNEFDNLTHEKFDAVKKPMDNYVYKDIKRQLWHDFRVYIQMIIDQQQPPKAKISVVRGDILKQANKLSSKELIFITDLKGKRKLTQRQESWLRDIAERLGVDIEGEFINRLSKGERNKITHCQHEDLGSLGYNHGEWVTCPFCGKQAEVW